MENIYQGNKGLVVVVYPVEGGYMARIVPLGVLIFNEDLEELTVAISDLVEQYEMDLAFTLENEDGSIPVNLVEWDMAVDESDIFLMDNEDERVN
jgi:hypothetical protein